MASNPDGIDMEELKKYLESHGITEFKEKGDEIEMFVKDNGSGVENAQSLSDLQKSNSLGMTIVNSLVIKLRASIEFVSENGMSVSVKFRC